MRDLESAGRGNERCLEEFNSSCSLHLEAQSRPREVADKKDRAHRSSLIWNGRRARLMRRDLGVHSSGRRVG